MGNFVQDESSHLSRSLRQTLECLVFKEDIQYPQDDPNLEQETSWGCELESGAILTLDLDDLPPGIRDQLESGVDLLTIPKALVSKTSIKIRGKANVKKKKIKNWRNWRGSIARNRDNFFNRGSVANRPDNFFDLGSRRLAETGNKTVLVVRVVAADGSTSFSTSELSDAVFGTDGDLVNLKSQYAACSYDQFNFNPAPNRAVAAGQVGTNIVNGATEVSITTTIAEGDIVMRNAITDKLLQVFNVSSIFELTDHVMYCLPSGSMAAIAYAFVPGWMSVYRNEWCTYVSGVSSNS